MYVDGEEFVLK